jgi:hypothetical protein
MAGGPIEPDRETEALAKTELRQAYERGRKDERALRRRHPVSMTLTFVLALVGVATLVLAAVNGSFAGAGQMADNGVAQATGRAAPVVSRAAADTRDQVASLAR